MIAYLNTESEQLFGAATKRWILQGLSSETVHHILVIVQQIM
jgi:hypothetical protein